MLALCQANQYTHWPYFELDGVPFEIHSIGFADYFAVGWFGLFKTLWIHMIISFRKEDE